MMLRYAIVVMTAVACTGRLAAQTRPVDPLIGALAEGDSAARSQAIVQLQQNRNVVLDEAMLAALKQAAADPNPAVSSELARFVGGRWIWNAQRQHPGAIQLTRELARSSHPEARYNAVYFGLSTVRDKTDDDIRAMLHAGAVAKDYDPVNLHGRIAWGLKGVAPQRFAKLCEPYWAQLDENEHAAWMIYRLYVQMTDDEPPQAERFAAIKKKVAEEEAAQKAACGARVPELAKQIRDGDSEARMMAFNEIYRTKFLWQALDESVLNAMTAAADDPSERVRAEVARISGNRWVWSSEQQHPRAIELALRLRKDSDYSVRHYAVYFGLSTVREPSDEVIRALVDSGVVETDHNTTGRAAWGLKNVAVDRLLPFFQPYFDKADGKATRAAKLYTEITGGPPPRPQNVQAAQAAANSYASALHDLYEHLGRVYPAFEIKQIDWKKVGDKLLPRVKDVKSDEEFGLLCMELIARLEDSHASLLPGTAPLPAIEFPRFDPGFACVIDDRERPVVYTVTPGSPAEKAGVRVGMAVVSVNEQPAKEALAACMKRLSTYVGYSSSRVLRYDAARMFVRQMRSGETVQFVLEDPDGAQHKLDAPATLGVRYLPRLPVPIDGINDSADVSWKMLDGDIGYIYVRRIRGQFIESLDSAVGQLSKAKGLIIDVRGNTGGGFDAQRALRNFDTNDGQEPLRPRFAEPIALLIDERTISAGEGWASWFIANRRARVFGTATGGASSRKAEYTLTNGLYKVIVPVKAYTGFLDRPIERRGLEPDVPIRVNAKDLAAGKDTVLEAAREHLMKTPAP